MADRFYVNCPLAPGRAEVMGPEAHHLAVVCRVRRGDAVCLFNGDGREYPAEVREIDKRAVVVEVQAVEAPQREAPYRLEVAAPLPKGDRAPFLIEKLTELGVAVFTPLQTARSVVHPREAKLDRLQRHVIEASKQCGRNVLMAIGPLTAWADFLRRGDLPAPEGAGASRRRGVDAGGRRYGRGGGAGGRVHRRRGGSGTVGGVGGGGVGAAHPARGDGGDRDGGAGSRRLAATRRGARGATLPCGSRLNDDITEGQSFFGNFCEHLAELGGGLEALARVALHGLEEELDGRVVQLRIELARVTGRRCSCG